MSGLHPANRLYITRCELFPWSAPNRFGTLVGVALAHPRARTVPFRRQGCQQLSEANGGGAANWRTLTLSMSLDPGIIACLLWERQIGSCFPHFCMGWSALYGWRWTRFGAPCQLNALARATPTYASDYHQRAVLPSGIENTQAAEIQ